MSSFVRKGVGLTAVGISVIAVRAIDINGGTSWGGWSSAGFSDPLGVYGSGPTAARHEVFTSAFTFNNNSKSGSCVGGGPTGGVTGFGTGAFSTGAFANGNRILGIGVRIISGGTSSFKPSIRFDLDGDSHQAATSVGGSDGQTSFTHWSESGDFTVQFEGGSDWRGSTLTLQVGNGVSQGGRHDPQQLVGGFGSGVSYDFAFRAFAQADSCQMFFDLDAMESLYGLVSPFSKNPGFTGIGSIGDLVGISLNRLGDNILAFGVSTRT